MGQNNSSVATAGQGAPDGDVDLDNISEDEGLPFEDELLNEAMRWPPEDTPYLICNYRLLSWLQTGT
jgi:hypothetical protein